MCGRYSLEASPEELEKRYNTQWDVDSFEKQKEIFPTHSPIVLLPNHKFYPVKWGFTPGFTKKPLINARIEGILDKKTFKVPFEKQRCIIPATSFFEWKVNEETKEKEKFTIEMENLPIFSMAGICQRYPNKEGENVLTFSIITTEATNEMKAIHQRMPFILHPNDEESYLNLKLDPTQLVQALHPLSQGFRFKKVNQN
ncbi:SOS response-associated peptidase [Lacticigenium naphthae]|uniref:SOS response-associated peptidase n=1 Tax=Lacticigenium naphthae TaxID=515351 RepID=UPI000425355B|nr:SOS response-associated peptidase [Lacticigenium naphthae]